jgi:hypothetical protein
MWHRAMAREAVRLSWVRPCYPDYCIAVVAERSCWWPTVATLAGCRAMFVEGIEEIAVPAPA